VLDCTGHPREFGLLLVVVLLPRRKKLLLHIKYSPVKVYLPACNLCELLLEDLNFKGSMLLHGKQFDFCGAGFQDGLNPSSHMRAHGACLTRSRTTQSANPCLCNTTSKAHHLRARGRWRGGMVRQCHSRKLLLCPPHYCQTPEGVLEPTASLLFTSSATAEMHDQCASAKESSHLSSARMQGDFAYSMLPLALTRRTQQQGSSIQRGHG
jgi:hypothetical protein